MDNYDEMELPPYDINELYNKIYNNIPRFKTFNELYNELSLMKIKSDKSVDEFRKILLDFVDMIVNISDNILAKTYKENIIDGINKHPKKIIDTFIIHGYMENDGQYRKEILIGNDNFFMTEKYTANDSNIISYISHIKDFWHKLNDDNKFLIKTYLMTLCHYSDKRFIIFKRYLEIKKLYNSEYDELFAYFDKEL